MPSLFTTQPPASPAANDGTPYELGMKFMVAKAGVISAIRYYKSAGDSAAHVGRIWSPTGTPLASVTFSGETASGWQQQALPTPLKVQANTIYTVSVNAGNAESCCRPGEPAARAAVPFLYTEPAPRLLNFTKLF